MKLTHALIIPGFSEQENDTYQQIEQYFVAAGITPVFVPITWQRTVLTDNLKQFKEIYAQYNPNTTVIFGFSLGALIACIAAAECSPAVLILASMVPWFAEDVAQRSDYHKTIVGHRRLAVYAQTPFAKVASHITSKTYILVSQGEGKRWASYMVRARDAHTQIRGSELIVVPSAIHGVGEGHYLAAIQQVIAKLA